MIKLLHVTGQSMLPTLNHGDFVLVCQWPFRWFRKGQLVVVNSSTFGPLVKRISSVDSKQGIRLSGDNVEGSLTTAQMGWYQPPQILGKVIYSICAKRTKNAT